MKRYLFLLLTLLILAGTSCNRSSCPAFDENPGDKALNPGQTKTKSGVYPPKSKKR